MFNLFGGVRPDERRAVVGAFITFLGIMAGHALLETARDALFLARLPASQLPWVYLGIAASSLILYFGQEALTRERGGRTTLGLWLTLVSVITLGFWFLVETPETWSLYALYMWPGVVATVVVVRFWALLGDIFTVTQAKRLFAVIGAGSLAGAILGSAGARVLTQFQPAANLLPASSVMFVISACALALIPKPVAARRARAADSPLERPVRTVLESPYLRRVAGVILVSTVVLTLVDFLFKQAVAASVAPDQLGSFFATAYLVLNLLSLGAQLLIVPRLLQRLGVHRVLSVLPALLALGAAGMAAGGGLVAALITKAFDGTLRHSLHRTASEVLFVPLAVEVRGHVKGLIDVVGQRGGQALASLFLLAVLGLSWASPLLAGVVVVLSGVWIVLANGLKEFYLGLFRQSLSDVALNTRFEYPDLDLASLETLIAALNSPNDGKVLATIDMLAEQKRVHLIPALILYHPSALIAVRALELFIKAGREDFIPMVERLLQRDEPEVRAAALRAMAWVAPSAELYERFAYDAAPVVRASALVGWVSYGRSFKVVGARGTLERLAREGTLEEKRAVAQAVQYSPGAQYEQLLLTLAQAPSSIVRRPVARAMREILSPVFIPSLLEMLARRAEREEARKTLVAIGPAALSAMDEALGNPHGNRAVRKQLPRAIAEFHPGEASDILIRRLLTLADGGVRYRVLRALGWIRARYPALPLDQSILDTGIRETVSGIFQFVHWEALLISGTREDPDRATVVQGLLFDLLKHREALGVERLFRLLGLRYSEERVRDMYRGLLSGNRDIQASSMELLGSLLRPPTREAILALVDTISDQEKIARAGTFYTPIASSYEELMRSLLERGGTSIRCLAVYHIGELGLESLREELMRLPSDPAGLVSRAVDRALAQLDLSLGLVAADGSRGGG